mmetsp:Transcript_26361/g.88610  ORF Transcript_26361/g.88610 Transcript_26361/m.88610 type:complete len:405 (+) Transcript_26361:110-1324(+)
MEGLLRRLDVLHLGHVAGLDAAHHGGELAAGRGLDELLHVGVVRDDVAHRVLPEHALDELLGHEVLDLVDIPGVRPRRDVGVDGAQRRREVRRGERAAQGLRRGRHELGVERPRDGLHDGLDAVQGERGDGRLEGRQGALCAGEHAAPREELVRDRHRARGVGEEALQRGLVEADDGHHAARLAGVAGGLHRLAADLEQPHGRRHLHHAGKGQRRVLAEREPGAGRRVGHGLWVLNLQLPHGGERGEEDADLREARVVERRLGAVLHHVQEVDAEDGRRLGEHLHDARRREVRLEHADLLRALPGEEQHRARARRRAHEGPERHRADVGHRDVRLVEAQELGRAPAVDCGVGAAGGVARDADARGALGVRCLVDAEALRAGRQRERNVVRVELRPRAQHRAVLA